MPTTPPYLELRAHSAFSFNAAATSPETLAARAAALGYPALGITDCADLGGVVRLALECARQGIRPIVGAELIVDGKPLALLARTAEGYRNIAALITRSRSGELRTWARAEGSAKKRASPEGGPARGRPALAWRDVAERASGVIALSGPPNGALASLVRAGKRGEAARL
ncbi:MAG: PHP domain-containing protein, partial [Gemmatimonadaceae bacterium]|nr:PHP domain-containing protein [Gemmatimonadaceae bacterium]